MRFVYGDAMWKGLLALLACAAFVASTDSAAARPADGQLWAEVAVAEEFWKAQGFVTACAAIHARIAPYPWPHDEPVDGWTTGFATCDLAITPRVARITRRALWKWSGFELAQECGRVVHEYGHGALGLHHEDEARFPIMAGGLYDEAVPAKCWRWARENRRRALAARTR